MRVGKLRFDRALARAAPEQRAVHEGFEGGVDLVVVARRRVEEAVEATAHVAEHEVAADQGTGGPHRAETGNPHWQADDEELCSPDRGDNDAHAEIRLQDQQRENRAHQQGAEEVARHPALGAALRQEPGRDHGEAGLGEFRGLQAGKARHGDPSPRTFDLDADDEGGGQQHHTAAEHQQGKPPDMTR